MASYRTFCTISLIGASCCILGSLSLEIVNTAALPPKVLEQIQKTNGSNLKRILNNTRRILHGVEAKDRPYMVYLKLPASNTKIQDYKRWLCGGVIVHEEYILTSAACIEDVKFFYVVSGTYTFAYDQDRFNNVCIKNGAKKAVWKCIPKNYIFDGHENDNIRWMNNDIAVVKLDDEIDFTRKVRGCEFIPKPICYNNQSSHLEEPGTEAFIAGWGSIEKYGDWVNSRRMDDMQVKLLETYVKIMSKGLCKKRWGKRYYNIIENYMICTNDYTMNVSPQCLDKYVDCTDITGDSDEDEERRRSWNPDKMHIHSANHNHSRRQTEADKMEGGFCENDHGGPLVYGEGTNSIVIGIISACLVKEKTNQCYGPYLYTSVYKNQVLINCAIYKSPGACNKRFRTSETDYEEFDLSWADHPDGPAKTELKVMRRAEEERRKKATLALASTQSLPNNTAKSQNSSDHQPNVPLQLSGLPNPASEPDSRVSLKKILQPNMVKLGEANATITNVDAAANYSKAANYLKDDRSNASQKKETEVKNYNKRIEPKKENVSNIQESETKGAVNESQRISGVNKSLS